MIFTTTKEMSRFMITGAIIMLVGIFVGYALAERGLNR